MPEVWRGESDARFLGLLRQVVEEELNGGGVLLLTGVPGIGKTTVIRRVAARLQKRRIGGFYTEEIREDSDRRGFRLVGFDGSEGVIADVDFPKVPGSGSTASTWRQSTRPPIA
jgi:hypothetical protein